MATKKLTAKEVMRPHRENKEYAYIRIKKNLWKGKIQFPGSNLGFEYDDKPAGRRIISANRAEEAVEILDFIKVCQSEDLDVNFIPNGKVMVSDVDNCMSIADNIRSAYFQYKLSKGKVITNM